MDNEGRQTQQECLCYTLQSRSRSSTAQQKSFNDLQQPAFKTHMQCFTPSMGTKGKCSASQKTSSTLNCSQGQPSSRNRNQTPSSAAGTRGGLQGHVPNPNQDYEKSTMQNTHTKKHLSRRKNYLLACDSSSSLLSSNRQHTLKSSVWHICGSANDVCG